MLLNKTSELNTDDFPFLIEYVKQDQPHNMPAMHVHDHYEFFYLLSGERIYFINDRTYALEAGDIILIKPGVMHKTVNQGAVPYERILIYFKPDFLDQIHRFVPDFDIFDVFQSELLSIRSEDKTFTEMLLYKMIQAYDHEPLHAAAHLKILLSEVLLVLADTRLAQPELARTYPNAMHKKISEIIQYINKYYSDKLSLEFIEEHFYISRFHFSRHFKAIVGMTFTEYLNFIRIREAQTLLRNSTLAINDISYRCGFNSQSHFSRVFKDSCSMTALEYRYQSRQN